MGADLLTRGYQPGFRSLWVPRLPDLIPVQGEPRGTVDIVQGQEKHPSRWTCAQEELSVPEASKEGPAGGLGALGRGWRPVGWTPEGPVLLHLTALGLHPSSLCPISGLLSASPQCQDLGSSTWTLCQGSPWAPLSVEGRPPWDPSPPEMEQLQKLCSSVPEVPLLSQDALGVGAEMSPGTTPRCPHRSGTLG